MPEVSANFPVNVVEPDDQEMAADGAPEATPALPPPLFWAGALRYSRGLVKVKTSPTATAATVPPGVDGPMVMVAPEMVATFPVSGVEPFTQATGSPTARFDGTAANVTEWDELVTAVAVAGVCHPAGLIVELASVGPTVRIWLKLVEELATAPPRAVQVAARKGPTITVDTVPLKPKVPPGATDWPEGVDDDVTSPERSTAKGATVPACREVVQSAS